MASPGYDEMRGGPLLPWSWAEAHLATARTYWLSTVRPDGRPHAMPVWAVWQDDALLFSTGRRSRKARNLAANAWCVVSVEAGPAAVVVEGRAEELEGADLSRFNAAYFEKYQWQMEGWTDPIFRVIPTVVFGFEEDDAGRSTRWTFQESP